MPTAPVRSRKTTLETRHDLFAAPPSNANELLGRVSDEIWNSLGRPRSDPGLTVLFPGGIAYDTAGAVEEQPRRMDLLAELLESRLHARVPAERAAAYAGQVRASTTALRVALPGASGSRAGCSC